MVFEPLCFLPLPSTRVQKTRFPLFQPQVLLLDHVIKVPLISIRKIDTAFFPSPFLPFEDVFSPFAMAEGLFPDVFFYGKVPRIGGRTFFRPR